jgi:hypothetical protein
MLEPPPVGRPFNLVDFVATKPAAINFKSHITPPSLDASALRNADANLLREFLFPKHQKIAC